MASIRSTDTKPEIVLRRALSMLGYKYRKNYGKYAIDIAFPGKKLAVLCDGCYWHCCPIHGHEPKSNIKYWHAKLQRNKARDSKVNALLKADGWIVIRVWEHDIKNDLKGSIFKIEKQLKAKS
jgi:DNA mismatch endonuclease (patch repair protein)